MHSWEIHKLKTMDHPPHGGGFYFATSYSHCQTSHAFIQALEKIKIEVMNNPWSKDELQNKEFTK